MPVAVTAPVVAPTAATRSSENPSPLKAALVTATFLASKVSPSRIALSATDEAPSEPTASRYTSPESCTVWLSSANVPSPLVPVPSVAKPTVTLPVCRPAVWKGALPRPRLSVPAASEPAPSCCTAPVPAPKPLVPESTALSLSLKSPAAVLLRTSTSSAVNALPSRTAASVSVPPLATTLPPRSNSPEAFWNTVANTDTVWFSRLTSASPVPVWPTEVRPRLSVPDCTPAVAVEPV